ncbi:MAG: glycosyltransferase family 2 protein [Bacteroidetes bacterium]|nr:glycosyltransferase family 2 protein [Bacteroidota bacterium]
MSLMVEAMLWLSGAGIVYTYLVYPAIIWLLSLRHRRPPPPSLVDPVPKVSVVISAFNEESVLREKLNNLSSLVYPSGRIEFLIGSDGSSDGTVSILQASTLPGLRVLAFPERRGKCAVLNDLVSKAGGEIVVFSDANTIYDCQALEHMIRHFADHELGGVCGELKLRSGAENAAGKGESSYWKYETAIKKWESAYKTTVGATGGVYAIRKALYKPLPVRKPIVDDFLIPLEIVRRGYRMIYEPQALVFEETSASVSMEFRRRVRIGAQNFSGIPEFADLLNPFRGFIAFALWSHKILRWCVPFLAIVVFVASAILAPMASLYATIFVSGLFLLALAGLGGIAERLGLRIGFLGIPFYIVVMNLALFAGFLKFVTGRQQTTWNVDRTPWAKLKNG